MVKRLLSIILLGSLTMSVGAQQLANTTFDADWVNCYPWEAGIYVSNARGTQPEGWRISNVSQSALPIVGEEVEPGANGSGKAVKLKNVAAEIGSNNAPGYITLGTPWATAETKMTNVRNADGGVFGGINFTYHPDAVRLTYKCDRSKGAENMSVIAYLWKGTWTQQNVPSNTSIGVFSWGEATKVTMIDRINNILGKDCLTGGITDENNVKDWQITKSEDAELIASVEYYSNASKSNWTTEEFPLEYKSTATPAMLNIVISANGLFDDRGTIKSGNSLTIDDVELVYWHGLKSLTCNGSTLNFTDGTTSYDFSSVTFDEASLSYSIKGRAATVASKSYNAETAVLILRVEGEDIASNPDSYTEYTVQFKQPVVGPEVVSSQPYSEDLYVSVAGETGEKQVADVLVETLDNGNINFVLKNFVLGEGENAMAVGNIAVNNIEVADDGSFIFNEGIAITEGDGPAPTEDGWLGPAITMMCGGSVPLNMSGMFIGEDHVVVYIGIDITSVLQAMGDVQVHLGYARATMAVNATAKYGTFCAPFAVEIPESVTASTVTAIDANGLLTLTALNTTNIPANTPVVLFAASGLETIESFGIAEEGTPTVGKLTGVYENTLAPVGSYVLQNLDSGVAFYQVATGQQPTVGANRCYLTLGNNDSPVKALVFPDGTQTSISEIQAADEKAVIYDLSGRRVSKATKGIYITHGKKFLVK